MASKKNAPITFDGAEEGKFKISAKVVDRETGKQEFENIHLIRVISKNHNLLIMEDFMPVIGEITGRVEFVVGEEKVVRFENLHGFYMHQHNEFQLLIESYYEAED